MTTIKNVTEGGKKLKSLIRFHSANKIENYNRGGKKEKKSQKNLLCLVAQLCPTLLTPKQVKPYE